MIEAKNILTECRTACSEQGKQLQFECSISHPFLCTLFITKLFDYIVKHSNLREWHVHKILNFFCSASVTQSFSLIIRKWTTYMLKILRLVWRYKSVIFLYKHILHCKVFSILQNKNPTYFHHCFRMSEIENFTIFFNCAHCIPHCGGMINNWEKVPPDIWLFYSAEDAPDG